MTNTYKPQTHMWAIDSTGTLWTNTLGGVPSETIGPKWVTRVVFYPQTAAHDIVFQETTSSQTAFSIKAGATDNSPVTIDWSAEHGGKGRRLVGLKVTTLDGTSTAELFVA